MCLSRSYFRHGFAFGVFFSYAVTPVANPKNDPMEDAELHKERKHSVFRGAHARSYSFSLFLDATNLGFAGLKDYKDLH